MAQVCDLCPLLSIAYIKEGTTQAQAQLNQLVIDIKVPNETQVEKLDLTGLSKGVYFLRVSDNEKVYDSKKLVIGR